MESPVAKLSGRISDPAVLDLLNQGIEHFAGGRLSQAAVAFTRVLEIDPDNGDAYNLSGLVALKRGDARVARQLIARAIASMPMCGLFQYNLGHAQMAQGAVANACASFLCAHQIEPRDVAVLLVLGEAEQARQSWDAAVEALQKAAKIAPMDEDIYLRLARVLTEADRAEEAVAAKARAQDIARARDADAATADGGKRRA